MKISRNFLSEGSPHGGVGPILVCHTTTIYAFFSEPHRLLKIFVETKFIVPSLITTVAILGQRFFGGTCVKFCGASLQKAPVSSREMAYFYIICGTLLSSLIRISQVAFHM